jgi:hypothetical protein
VVVRGEGVVGDVQVRGWRPPVEWMAAINRFAILFGDRFVQSKR